MKLDIGAGFARHGDGFLTVDAICPADIRALMWSLPLDDGAVAEIWSSHALEHVPLERVQPTLREWRRVLAPGGLATITVPDLDYAAAYWLGHQGEPWALAILFGNQIHPGEFHNTGWSPGTFHADLIEAGFDVLSLDTIVDHGQGSIRAIVTPA